MGINDYVRVDKHSLYRASIIAEQTGIQRRLCVLKRLNMGTCCSEI